MLRIVVELSKETDGRWIADVLTFNGVLAYGDSLEEAVCKVAELTCRVLIDDYGYNKT